MRGKTGSLRLSSFPVLLALAIQFLTSLTVGAEVLPDVRERLIATGKLWVTVQYFHPYLAYRDIDWDKALTDALPAIRTAKTEAEYRDAVQTMLAVLQDPGTYVRVRPQALAVSSLHFDAGPNGTLTVSNAPAANSGGSLSREIERLLAALDAPHQTIVFDQRLKDSAGTDLLSECLEDDRVARKLLPRNIDAPGQRSWIHQGLPPVKGANPGRYHSEFSIQRGRQFIADANPQKAKLVFLLGENSRIATVTSALWASNQAAVLSESSHYELGGTESVRIPLGQTIEAVVSLSEPILAMGSGFPEIPLTRAVAAPQGTPVVPPHPSPLPVFPISKATSLGTAEAYPNRDRRVLAAYEVWGAFRNFFAYRDLMDEDWDDVFSLFLPVIEAAGDAREYNLAIAEMVSHVFDSQATVESPTLSDYFGVAPAGLRLRIIEGKPMVTQIFDPAAVEAGVKVGDLVTAIDGEEIASRAKMLTRYVAFSTQQRLGFRLMQTILNGPDGSIANLSLQDGKGNVHQVQLKRSLAYARLLESQRDGEVTRVLPGNVGYVDVERLDPGDIDAMFDRFENASAIIFDLRGGAPQVADAIGSRLATGENVAAAIYTGPLTMFPDLPSGGRLTQTASYFFVQTISPTLKKRYKGPTLALVDERTIGAAEHTALFLEAANKTEFIGTPSAGADGDITNFVVPGQILIHFTGNDVRHGNTGKLQRVGIQPNLTVAPTVAGIRQGRDEVLEKALDHLNRTNGVPAGME